MEVLREMRKVKSSDSAWRDCVRQSGLANILATICAPDTTLELSCDEISRSYRYHSWKESFGEILERWTPDWVFSNNTIEEVCHTPFISKTGLILPVTGSHHYAYSIFSCYILLCIKLK